MLYIQHDSPSRACLIIEDNIPLLNMKGLSFFDKSFDIPTGYVITMKLNEKCIFYDGRS